MRHICEQLKVNDTVVKNNIINFSERPKEAQETFPQTAIPTASEVAYYTLSAVTHTGFFVATSIKIRQGVRYETYVWENGEKYVGSRTLVINPLVNLKGVF